MFAKPFKPLTIRKTFPTDGAHETAAPTPKRRKLSPSEEHEAPSQTDARPPTHVPKTDLHGRDRRVLKGICNPSSPGEESQKQCAGSAQLFYSVLWRIPTNKKNKTWTDDGTLTVANGLAVLYNNAGKVIGRTPCAASLSSGSTLSIAGKEVEVDSHITKDEHFAASNRRGIPSHGDAPSASKPSPVSQPYPLSTTPRPALQTAKPSVQSAQTRTPSHQWARPLQVMTGSTAFKQPLKDTTVLPPGSSDTLSPRHDPSAVGSLVFKRPQAVPAGRQVVDVVLDPLLGKRLRPHQKEGVQFLYECVMSLRSFGGQGCILADDMGLGKTLTTIALLWTLLRQSPIYRDPPAIRKALIVCPVSLIRNWKREFRKWLGPDRLGVLEFDDQTTRLTNFDGKVFQVMIIGYERLRMVAEDLAKGQPIDIVVCDEGHRLKTIKNKNVKAIESLNTRRRIILSGTPIQNDLGEFYAMVNFVNDGCLGSQKGFLRDFEKPIMRSRQPDASEDEIERGRAASAELAQTTSPFILRRTADILADFLPPKTEYVLFCKPTKEQAKLYRHVLQSPMFHAALRSNETAFQLITILKKLCNSPALMNPTFGDDEATPSSSLTTLNEMLPEGSSRLYLNKLSSKIRLLDELLQQIRHTTDEKVIVVSNYTSTLGLIEQLLVNSNLSFLRIDGNVPAKKRQPLIDEFNRTKSAQAFALLLSAKAGGYGLNLVGASRLVLFDVDWNPATDDQAMARIHRQGQTRPCKIYRFLIKGGLEERIWQRQAVKRALADSIMQGGSTTASTASEAAERSWNDTSTFSQEELKDLFRLDESDGLRTHDLIGCSCRGDGTWISQDFFGDDSSDETTGQSEAASDERCAGSGVLPGPRDTLKASTSFPSNATSHDTQAEMEAKRSELMKYCHLDTSCLPGIRDAPRTGEQVLNAIDDPCLEHVLSLDHDITGGGGIAYVFKRTKGSQVL